MALVMKGDGGPGSFSGEAWTRNAAACDTIGSMPFNAELAAGTLPRATFQHYIVQDAHYLIGFGRALSLAAAKAPEPDGIVQFSRAAQDAIVVERALHGGFFRDYVSYLLATAYAEPFEVVCAALLPCFWIYKAVGDDIFARAAADNPYRAWIDTYAGEEFAEAVAGMIAATDHAALTASVGTRQRMHRAFTQATRLEWMFWDSAYRDAGWPV
jgi:thiaminase/transcriptional activator TenA